MQTSADDFIDDIVRLVQNEEWVEAIERVSQDSPEVICLPATKHRVGGLVMGAACYEKSVPLEFFQAVVEATGNESAIYQDAGLRTPLHMVLIYLDRPDICRFLIQTVPSSISICDHGGLRPIDIMTQKILIKEERMRYLKKDKNRSTTISNGTLQVSHEVVELESKLLEDCWECARLLCLAHGGELEANPNLPLLHACCLGHRSVPLSLLHRALQKCKNQLAVQDETNQETPLQILARQFEPAYRHHNNSNDNSGTDENDNNYNHSDEEEEDESDFLEVICDSYPQAAAMLNQYCQYPLDVAIIARRKWKTGCRKLLRAYPPALLHQIESNAECRYKEKIYLSLLLHGLLRQGTEFLHDILFQVLRSRPQLLSESPFEMN